jgi:mRNA interferase MazF
VPSLALVIDPTPENGCTKPSYALSHCVTTNSKQRLRPTQSYILPEQLAVIRRQIALAIGLE